VFRISNQTIQRNDLIVELNEKKAGALVVFEGWVRNHNEGKAVTSLEYQVYHELALKEGERILQEAIEKFNLHQVLCVHREGHLLLEEVAVWIGATASHRDDAFKATRYIIDEVKHRLPVWKKEHYQAEQPKWVYCQHHHHHVHFEEHDYYQKQSKLVDQNKLAKSHVIVIGAGGLGCPVLTNLSTAGVGEITIIDFDKISISNIHRQTLYSPNLVGEAKAVVAKHKLAELNPFIKVNAICESVKFEHLKDADLIIDCTDSIDSKYFIHDACIKLNLPLISASIYQFEGQIRTFIREGCLHCQVEEKPQDHLIGNCNDFGVLGVSTAILGSMQAQEAISFLLTGKNQTLLHTLFINLKDFNQMRLKNLKASDCKFCQGEFELNENDLEVTIADQGKVVDIRNLEFSDLDSFKNSHEKIILCCHRGVKSKHFAQKLRAEGHQNFYSLKGGACSL
jgi:adenylyltransferase/sulfurtransferase